MLSINPSPVVSIPAGLLARKEPEKLFVPKAPAILRGKFRDGMFTYDARTVDSTGAFLNGELERLDQKIHEPLSSVTWTRDIDLREDVSMGDEMSSYTNSWLQATGGLKPGGKAWISTDANAITGVALDIGKTLTPLHLWGMEVKWTLPELASAEKIGRPIDSQKYDAMKLKWNMDVDEQVYIGDTTYGEYGLFNLTQVTPSNAVNGASGSPLWINKSPQEILADFNTFITDVWAANGWAVMPNRCMLPPALYGYLSTQLMGEAGSQSILSYLSANNIVKQTGGTLEFFPSKWLIGRAANTTDNRVVLYTKDKDRIRFPMVPLQRTPIEYRSLYQITTYYGKLGSIELVYETTVGYLDGV